jgi:hypothetical protein
MGRPDLEKRSAFCKTLATNQVAVRLFAAFGLAEAPDRAAFAAAGIADSRSRPQPVLFRHKSVGKLMQKIHSLTDL